MMKLFLLLLGFITLVSGGNYQLEKLFQKSNDQFTAKLTNEVIKNSKEKNVVLSAFSVLPLLGQLAVGAVGDSQKELLQALDIPDEETTKILFRHVTKYLSQINGVELKIANRIYVSNNATLNREFAEMSRNDFNSDAVSIDFSDPVTASRSINSWVEDQTNDRITDLTSSNDLSPSPSLVLVNTVYFKGKWANTFDKQDSSNRDFHISKSKTKQIPTMFNSQTPANYGESSELDAKILEMPYKLNESSLIVVLPNELDGLDSLLGKLKDHTALSTVRDSLQEEYVDIYLPKFRIETETNLDLLRKLNIKKIFNPSEAKLYNLLNDKPDFFISAAKQKTFIVVDEEGTEAAAATVISGFGGINVPDSKVFKADHPFAFFMIARQQIIFSGVFRG